MKTRIFTIAYTFFLTTAATSALQAQDTTAIKQWISAQQNLKSLSATFTQTRTLRTLRKPLVSAGNFYYKAPNQFRWEHGNPVQTIAVHSDDTLTLLDVTKKRAQVAKTDGEGSNRSQFGAYFDMSFPKSWEEFDQNFNVLSVDNVDGVTHAKVSPKSRKLGRGMKAITFFIDSRNQLKGFSMEFKDRSTMETIFNTVREGATVPSSKFVVSLDGYQVQSK